MAMGNSLDLRDKHLLDRAASGWSPEEIAADTGMEPLAVYSKVSSLLASRDLWSEIQKRQLLLHSVYTLKSKLENWLDDEIFDKDKVASYLQTLRLIGDTLERNTKATEGQVEAVVEAHKGFMLGMLQRLSVAVVDRVHEKYPTIEMEEIDGIFTEVISAERANV